ncbi:methyltransferase family protein [Roseibium hamelinense]|uniref:Methyltransferase family protein n=1 Tax=Roseibium hamelinense TaxID=150831 RepID=A0A562SUL9_9HYPH|nr:class I SAM-dependent methyltransferase [Roseibium hamelinense]MTI42419.1 class I SAM-dependent methyltransferase [Roseibium hamelinense]TWI84694.1 methyltransferase family protein [Roseibium hamelinense]
MNSFPEQNRAGYAVYSEKSLRVYDALVLGFSNRFLWRCPSRNLVEHYQENVSEQHLDIGVGTGYFLDTADFASVRPDITLFDPNRSCLDVADKRLARFDPKLVQADALTPWPAELGTFKSIGLNYLLHCLPGTMADKSRIFDFMRPHLKPETIVFGSTIVRGDAPRGFLAEKLMRIYNKKGIFGNMSDTREGLETELLSRFKNVDIRLIGCVALFKAYRPV